MSEFKTPKGTELPILLLKGKQYLQVAHRLVWFREEHPDWAIETEVTYEDERAFAKCTIKNELGKVIAMAHGHESLNDFRDFYEKAETKAIGRALGFVGYGTQFMLPELDETENKDNPRIVDSPIQPVKAAPVQSKEKGDIESLKSYIDKAQNKDDIDKLLASLSKRAWTTSEMTAIQGFITIKKRALGLLGDSK